MIMKIVREGLKFFLKKRWVSRLPSKPKWDAKPFNSFAITARCRHHGYFDARSKWVEATRKILADAPDVK